MQPSYIQQGCIALWCCCIGLCGETAVVTGQVIITAPGQRGRCGPSVSVKGQHIIMHKTGEQALQAWESRPAEGLPFANQGGHV